MKFLNDDKRQQQRLEKLLKKAQRQPHVAVGILQDEEREDGFSMVDLAMVHEYGSQARNIPPRSFIRSTCDAKRKEHLELIRKFQWKILLGRITAQQALTQLGEVVSKDMVKTINNGIEPRLEARTVKRKGSSKPLIDTGRLKGSLTHEIRGGA
jgi:phage gpG-like protein